MMKPRNGSGERTGTARARLLVGVLLAVCAIGCVSVAAHATTPGAGTAASGSATGDATQSFARAFFVSTKISPGSNERRVELLGSLIIWLLLLLSFGSIGLIGYMALTNQRKSILPDALAKEVKAMLRQGKYREVLDLTRLDDSYFSQVLHAALRDANHGFAVMLRNLEQASEEHTANRFRRIEYLNVLGQVSPMIGLFGTVYGMILAFQAIVVAGGNADPVLLAGGIGTALTTTFWGLVVAIPALSGYAVVRNKIDALTAEASLAAEDIVAQFRPRPQNGSSGKSSAGNGGNG